MNIKSKSTLLLVLLTIVFLICSTLVLAISFKKSDSNEVYAEAHDHSGWTDTASLPSSAGNYYLTADVVISDMYGWTAPTGVTNLCLNGHKITFASSALNGIIVSEGDTLNLYDDGTETHKYKIVEHVAVIDDSYTADYKTFKGGYITGLDDFTTDAIDVHGVMNMYGGTVIGNKLYSAIRLMGNTPEFNMYGGAVIGNYSTYNTSVGVNTGRKGWYTVQCNNRYKGWR